jgi:hypothetical protein
MEPAPEARLARLRAQLTAPDASPRLASLVREVGDLLGTDDAAVKCEACELLAGLGPQAAGAVPALALACKDRSMRVVSRGLVAVSDPVAREAFKALAAVGAPAAPALAAQLREGTSLEIPYEALIYDWGGPCGSDTGYHTEYTQVWAAEALAKIGAAAAPAVPELERLARALLDGSLDTPDQAAVRRLRASVGAPPLPSNERVYAAVLSAIRAIRAAHAGRRFVTPEVGSAFGTATGVRR